MDKKILAVEQKRVDEVVAEIDEQLETTQAQLNKALTERRKVEATYGDTAKVNLAEVDDRMETNAAIQQQKQLVALAVENETILTNREKSLHLLQKSPYFGRIDINEDGETETLYIGTSSLITNDDEFLVYDWRAPISALYYNGTLGPATYDTPVGPIDVELTHKRQFKIVSNQIVKMFDTNETVADDILQDMLSEQSDTHMKNIVATVQQAQNEIIRNTTSDLLVVQGVAGSGKTSAILQRIAYLLYHAREKLEAEQIILFSPNNLFSNYIAEVLPSLGEKNMRQVTLMDFLEHRHRGFKIESLFERYERDQRNLPDTTRKIRHFKESAEFISDLREYLKRTPSDLLPFSDLVLHGEVIIGQSEIKQIYGSISNRFSLPERFTQTKNALIKLLKRRTHAYAKTAVIENAVENLSESQYRTLLGDKAESFASYDEEYEYVSYRLARRHLKLIYDAIYNDYFVDIYQVYLNFLRQLTPKDIDPKVFAESIHQTAADIELHQLKITDAVAIMFLRDLLTGSGQNHTIMYLFVDEMQDYSDSLFLYLAHAFPKARLTLLGDQSQSIFEYSNETKLSLSEKLQQLFPQKRLNYHELNTSYRSTMPITNFAKAVLSQSQIEAYSREGELPQVVEVDNATELLALYPQLVKEQLTKHKIVALITKTEKQAEELAAQLEKTLPLTLITAKSRSLKEGLLVLPIYLAKGLEFDSVIAHDVSAENYPNASDAEIIYTIASRALHTLTLTTTKQLSPLVRESNAEFNLLTKQETEEFSGGN